MIGYCPLASGSKGNCTVLGTPNTRILIDIGLSCRQICLRLEEVGITPETIDAVVITHEHSDHIRGLGVFCKKFGVPVYANTETAKVLLETYPDLGHLKVFTTGSSFTVGDVELHPFRIQHDAVDPVGLTATWGELKIGFCTDLGFATSLVRAHLEGCDYLYIEANHEPSMVHACARPMVYKQRVLSRSGHLSNQGCGELLAEVACDKLKHVHLAHLSSECNNPAVAVDTVKRHLQNVGLTPEITVAHQDVVSQKVEFTLAIL